MVMEQNTHGLGSGDVNLTPETAKLAAGLLREFIGDDLPEGSTVDGEDVGSDAYHDVLTQLDHVANQA